MKNRAWVTTIYIGLIAVTLAVFIWSVSAGSVSIPFTKVMGLLFSGGEETEHAMIVRQIRLPRALMALVSGGALSLSGYLLQTFFRNPIAGPYILGISSGARMMVAIAMIIVLGGGGAFSTPLMVLVSFIGSMISTVFILFFARRLRTMSVLLVAGIMISYICTAITDFIINLAGDSSVVNMHGWSQGSFSGASMGEVRIASFLIIIASLLVFGLSKSIWVYMSGEEYAASVGVPVRSLQIAVVVLSGLLSATVTAFAGPVSFVGIAVPFLVRRLIPGARPIVMIPALFLTGAAFTMASDLAARLLLAPSELSLSTVTAFVGVPIVLVMLSGGRHE
ncbi:FecCD family ABC transporter permease [Butyrivibrio sp. MC2013]|uniref:FecCD family ABC transporter permease n=1 Tax=Butyrivibrio sp. MC2013 TaxID=1280686 RepID=UPI0003F63654|nr:iron ABC transporter permease [Butyrivibrio sp. MC2013]